MNCHCYFLDAAVVVRVMDPAPIAHGSSGRGTLQRAHCYTHVCGDDTLALTASVNTSLLTVPAGRAVCDATALSIALMTRPSALAASTVHACGVVHRSTATASNTIALASGG